MIDVLLYILIISLVLLCIATLALTYAILTINTSNNTDAKTLAGINEFYEFKNKKEQLKNSDFWREEFEPKIRNQEKDAPKRDEKGKYNPDEIPGMFDSILEKDV